MRILSCRLTRVGTLVLLVLVALMLVASSAGAADGTPVSDHRLADLLTSAVGNPAVWLTAITAVLIPLLNTLLTHVSTIPFFKGLVTVVLTAVYALVAWLTSLGDVVVDWKAALGVFFGALVTAFAAWAGLWKGTAVASKLATVPIGIGPKMTPEKAAAKHSNGQDLTVPVPAELAPPQG